MSFLSTCLSKNRLSFTSSPQNSDCISVRIVQCDYHIQAPENDWDIGYSDFNQNQVYQIPVIRIFGPTSNSPCSCCVHVHGVLPYFYAALKPTISVDADFVKTFANACEQALKSSNRTYKKSSGNYIHAVEIVSGIPIYGYHENEQEFLKIYLYNPMHVSVLSDILVYGIVLGTVFQPHESHIPFIMQFLIDFNLYGMNFVHLSDAIMRVEADRQEKSGKATSLSEETSLEKDHVMRLAKQSICELEFDTFACCILNTATETSKSQKEKFCNPGLRAIWEDELMRQKLSTGDPDIRISNPVSPSRPTQKNDDLESEQLKELRSGLKKFFNSQTLDFITPKPRKNLEALERELCTPRKLDFDLGKAKASSTPFVGAQMMPSETPQPGSSDGNVTSFIGTDGLSVSVANGNLGFTDCASLVDFLQNDSEVIEFTQTEIAEVSNRLASQVELDPDEDDEPRVSNKDVSKLELLVKEARQDQAETWNLSQIVEYPRAENHPFEGTEFVTQLDGKNVLISDEEKNYQIMEFGKRRRWDSLDAESRRLLEQMKPCAVIIDTLDIQTVSRSNGNFDSTIPNSIFNESTVFRGAGRYRPELSFYDATLSSVMQWPKVELNCTTIEQLENSRAEFEVSYANQTMETLYDVSALIDENSPVHMEMDYMFNTNLEEDAKFECNDLEFAETFVEDSDPDDYEFAAQITDEQNILSSEETQTLNQKFDDEILSNLKSHSSNEGFDQHSLMENNASTSILESHDTPKLHIANELEYDDRGVDGAIYWKNGIFKKSIVMNEMQNEFLTIEGDTHNELSDSVCSSNSTKTLSTVGYEYLESNSPAHVFTEDHYIPDSPVEQAGNPESDADCEVMETSESHLKDTVEDTDATLDEIGIRMIFEDMQRGSTDLVDENISPASGSFYSEVVFNSGEVSPEIGGGSEGVNVLTFANLPPTRSHVMQTLPTQGLPEVDNDVYFDIISKLQPFHPYETDSDNGTISQISIKTSKRIVLTPALPPPIISKSDTEKGLEKIASIGLKPKNVSDMSSTIPVKEDDSSENENSPGSRPNSPSMFYSFMPPPSKRNNSATSDVMAAPLATQFGTRFSHTGISIQSTDKTMDIAAPNLSPVEYPCHRLQYLTIMSMELHVVTRGSLLPNPALDKIAIIFYSIFRDDQDKTKEELAKGIIIIDRGDVFANNRIEALCKRNKLACRLASSELDLVMDFSAVVKDFNPDILVGYEVQNMSWGYLLKRGKALMIDTIDSLFSRMPDQPEASHFDKSRDAFGADEMSEINLAGRIVLNMWRILRNELPLRSFTFEKTYFEVTKKRVPRFSYGDLTKWCNPYSDCQVTSTAHWYKTLDHVMTRCQGNLQILCNLNLVTRTSEMSRLFGILFFEVLTRGSQFRVESMLIRSAKSNNFIAASPSIYQRAKARAPEHIPLVLEPESAFYSDPVLVLDFQSLYPSMMIAYNYCYSTCLGRVDDLTSEIGSIFKLGCLPYSLPPETLKELIRKQKVHVAPNGVAYVDQSVRKGLISKMVEDILNTRIMVKRFMKQYKKDPVMYGMLDARQLGLKLIANVTYGYTGANFSGRMPCVEIADSIVRKARETLEKSIDLVNSSQKWNARVIYGDTDSMFVLLRGASKETSFKVGQEISEMITQLNPKPVKLKFEKVYYPCVLITKKRYVGYSYETLDQKEPNFDAKGIETVRRDNCPVVGKILEKTLRILFESKDLVAVKSYVQRQLSKITHERVGLDDFVFGKEFRGRDRYKSGACIAALRIADKQLVTDPMAEPLRGERVPYCIVYDAPGLPLYRLIRSPNDLIKNPMLRINSFYYITKQILPPLDRVFGLVKNCNVFDWFKELPIHKNQVTSSSMLNMLPINVGSRKRCNNMISFVGTKNCTSCFDKKCSAQSVFCDKCVQNCQHTAWSCNMRIAHGEKILADLKRICGSCSGHSPYVESCQRFDCPVFQKLMLTRKTLSVQYQLLPVLSTKF